MTTIQKEKIIQGEQIYLRPITMEDISERYRSWFSDSDVNKYIEVRNISAAELRSYVSKKINDPLVVFMGIFDKTNNKHIGNVKLEPIDKKNGRTIFSIVIGEKSYWGRGIGTESTRLISDYALNEIGLYEVELGVVSEHSKATHAYEKAGFKIYGTKKNAVSHNGIFYDAAAMIKRRQLFNANASIVIVGFGSIGRRHYDNLKTLGYENISLFDLDISKTKGANSLKDLNIKELKKFDIAFVCTPNSEHVEAALKCAQAGLHLFIEKPLSHSLKNVKRLAQMVREKKLCTMVACNMRFHPSLAFIKKYLEDGKLGKVYSISHEFGHDLSMWRKGVDYRKTYSAKKREGGGIILDDIHEFDLLFWFSNFSQVNKHEIVPKMSGALEIDVEDQVSAVFDFKNGVLGRVHSDYLSRSYRRQCLIIGENGNLLWDWHSNEVILENEVKRQAIFIPSKFEINDMYMDELHYFLSKIEQGKKTQNDVAQAAELLKYLIR